MASNDARSDKKSNDNTEPRILLFIPEAWKISGALLIIDKRMAYQI